MIEVLICFFQYMGFVNSNSDFFPVTGTMVNPNYTAMFIALGLPIIISQVIKGTKPYKYIWGMLLICSITTLVILKSRTAWIGSLVGGLYMLRYYYLTNKEFRNYIRNINFLLKSAILCLIVITAFFFANKGYHLKKESADSRLFIWNTSIDISLEKPFTGHGMDTFVKIYNLAQASYFQKNKGSKEETFNASHVIMAYNDHIQNLVEIGLIGSLLYFIFLGKLLLYEKYVISRDLIIPYTGIIIFIVMGLSYTVQYMTHLSALFIFYVSYIINNDLKKKDKTGFSINSKWNKIVGSFLIIVGSFFFYNQISWAFASYQIKKAEQLIKNKNSKQALLILEKIENKIPISEDYYFFLGKAFENLGQYDSAIEEYNKANLITTAPHIYLGLCNCHAKKGNYEKAIEACSIAANIEPSRIYPRYILMKVYFKKGDNPNAINMAQAILNQKEKGISKRASFYKKEARSFLNKLKK